MVHNRAEPVQSEQLQSTLVSSLSTGYERSNTRLGQIAFLRALCHLHIVYHSSDVSLDHMYVYTI